MEPTYLWTCTCLVFRDKWIAWDTQQVQKSLVVVKAALSGRHEQDDMERGFSLNNQIVDDTRIALKESTIIALRTVKEAVNRFDNVDRVQITSQLIRQFRGALATYKADLESVAQAA